jgi:hypothetical protein
MNRRLHAPAPRPTRPRPAKVVALEARRHARRERLRSSEPRPDESD